METAHDEKNGNRRVAGLGAGGLRPGPGTERRFSPEGGLQEKIEACQSVLNVLKKEKAHERFATQENVRVMDYQACIQARKTGNDQEVAKRCDQIWKEIRSNNGN